MHYVYYYLVEKFYNVYIRKIKILINSESILAQMNARDFLLNLNKLVASHYLI